jgi:PAS domain S-box-containing protein
MNSLEQRYTKLFDTPNTGNLIIDRYFNIVLANNFIKVLLQADNYNLEKKDFRFFIYKEFLNSFNSFFNNADDDNFNFSTELFLVSFLGKKILVNIYVTKIINDDQNYEFIISITDQTPKHKLELQLAESKEIYESLTSTLPIAIYRINRASIIIDANQTFADSVHRSIPELIGKSINEIYPKDIADKFEINNELAMRMGSQIKLVEDHIFDSQKIYIEIIRTPVKDIYGKIAGLQLIQHDITEIKKSEEVLKESEYKYRKLVEDSSDLFVISDGKGKILFVGSNCEKVTGYTQEEAIEIKIYEQVHSDDIDLVKSVYIKSFDNKGQTLHCEARFLHKSGHWVWFDMSVTNFDNDPIINGIITNIRDITERKETAELIAEAELRYRSLFNFLPDSISLVDPETRISIEFNQAACQQLGYTKEEYAKLKISDINTTESPVETQSRIERLLVTGFDQFETFHTKKDGSRISVLVKLNVIELNSKKYVLALYQDLTLIKQVQKEKYENEIKFKTIIENAFDGIYLLKGRNFLYVNESLCQIVGYTSDEFLSADFDLNTIISPNSIETVNERLNKIEISGYIPDKYEIEIINKNNEIKYVEVSTSIIEIDNSKVILGIMRDITNRKIIEIEVNKAREAALKSAEITNTILNNLGHELRTPLNGILGFSKILLSEIADEDQLEMVKMIYYSGERLKKTLGSLLTMSELESAKYLIVPELCNLSHFIGMYDDFTIDMLHHKDLKFELVIQDEDVLIMSDEYLLHQALYNILDNSYKFTDYGGIKLQVRKQLSANNKNKAFIEIIDTGFGIEQDKIDLIFLPFRQGSEGIQRKHEGMGLGLTIVQKIIQKLNAEIEIESIMGEGTTVRLIFDCQ